MKKAKSKKDVYEIVTQRIIDKLKAGVIPWQKKWMSKHRRPENFVSKRKYKGILNMMLLSSLGYDSPYFLTFNQGKKLKAKLRKGEKGCPVTFWKILDKEEIDKDTGEKKKKKFFFLRYFTVFNVEQFDDLDYPKPVQPEEAKDFDPIKTSEELIARFPADTAKIKHAGDSAFYSPLNDSITLPKKETFDSEQDYYNVRFHETVHSTGHSSRLDRIKSTSFGSNEYGKEELVAELGASFLCSEAGIFNSIADNSASYLDNWIKALKGDSKLLTGACSGARKAVEWLIGKEEQEEDSKA